MRFKRFFKRTKSVVRAHWYVPMLNYETAAREFYASIEEEIKGRHGNTYMQKIRAYEATKKKLEKPFKPMQTG